MRWLKRISKALLLCGFSVAVSYGILEVIASPRSAASTEEQAVAIETGADFERDRAWLEAIEHYKQALETWPDNPQLKYGLRRSKIHFGIDRRYTDKSFREELLRLNENDAYELLAESMSNVRTYYVDGEKISPTTYVAHGTESLYLALNNERFLTENLPGASPDRIKSLRETLRTKYWNKPIGHSSAVRSTIGTIARLAKSTTGLEPTPIVLEYIFGGCNALDDYSSFMTPGKLNDLYNNIEGEFVGLGIEMRAETGKGLLLVNVLPESPAEEGGLNPGEYIVEIDGQDCRQMTTDQAAGLLTGKSGSRVNLAWVNETEQMKFGDFTRREVKVKSIPLAYMADEDAGIGYIRMTGFQKTTAQELDEALQMLRQQGMKSLIWDLRGNPGGLLTAAVDVLDRFIDKGTLVSTKGRSYDQNWTYSAHRLGTWTVPLVVLVDGNSASASEIVAGAIRDHKRGLLVGRTTYGKWSVQSIFPGSRSTGMRLSTAKFYSPHDHWYGKIGVDPDIEVEPTEERPMRVTPETLAGDPDFLKALNVIDSRRYTSR